MQEALVAAAEHWPARGRPRTSPTAGCCDGPAALIDQRRSERSRADREDGRSAGAPRRSTSRPHRARRQLVLLFLCCHPALTPATAVALTLRAVGGLTTAEIARAFLVARGDHGPADLARQADDPATAGARFATADARRTAARACRSVLRVLYLMFNEGYAGPTRDDACNVRSSSREAIRLARLVHRAAARRRRGAGLLALMLLDRGAAAGAHRRSTGRFDLARRAGPHALGSCRRRGGHGDARRRHRTRAASVSTSSRPRSRRIHDRAASAEETDWLQIAALYELLERMTGNPVVTLNRAVAVGMASGPAAGLEIVAEVESELGDHPRLLAVRAHLRELDGQLPAAYADLRAAAASTTSRRERDHLRREAARVHRGHSSLACAHVSRGPIHLLVLLDRGGGDRGAVVLEDDEFVGFLDIRPVFKGHVLLVPRAARGDAARPAGGASRRLPGPHATAGHGHGRRPGRPGLVRRDEQHA